MYSKYLLVLIEIIGGQPPDQSGFQFPKDLYLVRGTAISVVEPKEGEVYQTCTFKIDEVYFGPEDLKGNKFLLSNSAAYPYPPSGAFPVALGDGFIGEIQVGEEGLWWVTDRGKQLEVQTNLKSIKRAGIGWFPFRKVKDTNRGFGNWKHSDDRYAIGLKWARALKLIYRAKDGRARQGLLKTLALQKDAPASGIAILLLGTETREKAVKQFLQMLVARKELSVIGQVTLDEVLANVPGSSWADSKERRQLLKRWITQPILHPTEYRFILARITDALHRNQFHDEELDLRLLLPILQPVLHKDGLLPKGRVEQLARLLRQLGSGIPEAQQAFTEFLIPLIQSSPFAEIRASAASSLRMGSPLTSAQFHLLRTIENVTPDKNLSKALRDGLALCEEAAKEK